MGFSGCCRSSEHLYIAYEWVEMLSRNSFNQLLIGAVIAVVATVVTCSVQDCQQNPCDCDAPQVLANYNLINVRISSSPSPPKLCEQYVRTSLSADGRTAEYNYTYRNAGADDNPIYDKTTAKVLCKNVLLITYASDPGTVIEFELLFINAAFCYVGQVKAGEMPYLLLDNPDAPLNEYFTCQDKITAYSNNNITFVRNLALCAKIPEKP